jgi:indole-3-glycerol phosphate synthase
MTHDKLEPIILQKRKEILTLPQRMVAPRISTKNFKQSLQNNSLSIIAEIKRCSPSRGLMAKIEDPVLFAKNYVSAGANAISILTDKIFFDGSIDDLSRVALALRADPTPILCKDFIIDKRQIDEAIMAGADAVLLIVRVLGEKTKELLDYTKTMNIDALIEVNTKTELDLAITIGSEIVAINNRDLSNFTVNTQLAFELIKYVPHAIIKVAASGILEPELAKRYYHAGFDAVLIGEALVKSPSPADFIGACRHE